MVFEVKLPLISPEPLAAIAPGTFTRLFLVQLKTVPLTLPLRTMVAIFEPEQMSWGEFVADTFGVGFTNTVDVNGEPMHPLASTGVMVKVTVTGAEVVLVKVPLIGEPEPLAATPCTLPLAKSPLSLVHV